MPDFIRPFLVPVVIGALLLAALAAEPTGQETTGTLQGHITFDGKTAPKGIIVADTVVCLTGDGLVSKSKPTKRSGPPVLDQKDITFVPHVLPVLAGTKVEIRNGDAILHNVHTTSHKNPPFNKAQLGNQRMEVLFEAPEIIRVVCDIHSQMSAYIVVLPNPYFTKTAKDGKFTLTDIPPGKYQLVTWHEKSGAVKTEVEISAGKPTPVEVNITATSNAAKL